MGVSNTAEEFTWMMRRQWAACRASGGHMALFDLHGGYYDDPDILRGVKELETLSAQAGPPQSGGGPAEITVVLDEDSCHFLRFRDTLLQQLLIQQVAEFPFVAPFAFRVGPLADLAPETKLVVFLNQFKLTAAERARQHALLKERHVTALYLAAPGYFAEEGASPDIANIEATLGMKMKQPARPLTGMKFSVEGAEVQWPNADAFVVDDPAAEIVAASGLPVGGAAVAQTSHDGVKTVFSGTGPLPRGYLRKLACEVGVHLYHDRPEDSIYCDGHFIALAGSKEAGSRTIALPKAAVLRDAFTHEALGVKGTNFSLELRPLEVRLLEFVDGN